LEAIANGLYCFLELHASEHPVGIPACFPGQTRGQTGIIVHAQQTARDRDRTMLDQQCSSASEHGVLG
jgi:hypothetical protein